MNVSLGLLSRSTGDIALVTEETQLWQDGELVLPPRNKQMKQPPIYKANKGTSFRNVMNRADRFPMDIDMTPHGIFQLL